MTPSEPGSFTAMITALAKITAAQKAGLTWNQIATRDGYPSGRQAKKTTHTLRNRVKQELAATAARQAGMNTPARGPARMPRRGATPPPHPAGTTKRPAPHRNQDVKLTAMTFPPGFREIPDPQAEIRRLASERARLENVTITRADLDTLLAVATLYINSFSDDEMMTLPQKLQLQDVEDVVKRHGRRY